ncbi:OTU7-like protein [Mya arenaria]|uniref:OTU7-like protein n=1 Tax=Mya arenaria TaxID=6604 RepID=A0ABY7DV39_MYAAR|nr:OTU7-like protein [Mya arenaria]
MAESFTCSGCEKVYSSEKRLTNHKCSLCTACGKNFSSYQRLHQHHCPARTYVTQVDTTNFSFKPVDSVWKHQQCTLLGIQSDIQSCSSHAEDPIGIPDQIRSITGDGNCFFRAISYVLTEKEISHSVVREKLTQYMKNNGHYFKSVLPRNSDIHQYIKQTNMNQDRVWGTEVELFAASHMLKTNILIYTRSGHGWQWQKISGNFLQSSMVMNNRCIYLQHTGGVHYDVVVSVKQSEALTSTLVHDMPHRKRKTTDVLENSAAKRKMYTRRNKRADPNNRLIENVLRNKSRADKRNNTTARLTENIFRNKTRAAKRADLEYAIGEKLSRNIMRAEKRIDSKYKLAENISRNRTRTEKRADPRYRHDENLARNKTRTEKRSDSKYRLAENISINRTRTEQREDPRHRHEENMARNKTRSEKRSDAKYKRAENISRNRTRTEQRADSYYRYDENMARNKTRSEKRSDSKYKPAENISRNRTRTEQRADSYYRHDENIARNQTRSDKRSDSKYKLAENISRNRTRTEQRPITDMMQTWPETKQELKKEDIENISRNVTRQTKRNSLAYKLKERKKQCKDRKLKRQCQSYRMKEKHLDKKSIRHRQIAQTLAQKLSVFRDLLKRGDNFTCTCCMQTFFHHSVYSVTKRNYEKKICPKKY